MKHLPICLWLLLMTLIGFSQTHPGGQYKIRHDQPKQVIWGLGFEIQNDAIASGNQGLPTEIIAVPNNLSLSERKRFYKEIIKGFRYCRLAMGLYFRGLNDNSQPNDPYYGKNLPDASRIIERYPNQLADLKEMMKEGGIEGLSVEYWSPAPFWKATKAYTGGGTIGAFDKNFAQDKIFKGDTALFLSQFGDALVDDINYLKTNGLKISMWGLQNEPPYGHEKDYSRCLYSPGQFYTAFKAIAPKIRTATQGMNTLIISDTHHGNSGEIGELIRGDKQTLQYVDAWVYHRIGQNSAGVYHEREKFTTKTEGKPVFQNEYEYLSLKSTGLETSGKRFINTAQNIMNWFAFANSPTWFWIHALKPIGNAEAQGYSLGLWNSKDIIQANPSNLARSIAPKSWDYNDENYNAVMGFVKHMPWDSRRYHVEEDATRMDNRILAFKTPKGKTVFVVTNRTGQPFTFRIDTGSTKKFMGYRYTPTEKNIALGKVSGTALNPTVPDLAVEFWVEN